MMILGLDDQGLGLMYLVNIFNKTLPLYCIIINKYNLQLILNCCSHYDFSSDQSLSTGTNIGSTEKLLS